MSLHSMTPCPDGHSLAFKPIGSAAKCANGTFYPDIEGDYETAAGARWQAMRLPPKMGPASSPVRFADSFQRTQTATLADQLLDTDVGVRGWQVVGQPQCTSTSDGRLQLRCATSSSNATNGVTTTAALPAFFAEPLSLVVSGVELKSPAASIAAVFGELTLLVSTRGAAIVSTASPNKTIVFAELHDTSCVAHGVTATMHANSANCSVEIQCTAKDTQTPPLWNAHGVPHGVHCRDALTASYDCGARIFSPLQPSGWFS